MHLNLPGKNLTEAAVYRSTIIPDKFHRFHFVLGWKNEYHYYEFIYAQIMFYSELPL